jgi:hypothetical protein
MEADHLTFLLDRHWRQEDRHNPILAERDTVIGMSRDLKDGYLVYTVSDLAEQENLRILAAMAPALRDALGGERPAEDVDRRLPRPAGLRRGIRLARDNLDTRPSREDSLRSSNGFS